MKWKFKKIYFNNTNIVIILKNENVMEQEKRESKSVLKRKKNPLYHLVDKPNVGFKQRK